MSPRDDTQAPPSWSTTQQWLDDLDSDTDAPPPDPDEDRDDLDSDTDALPPDPDEDRDDLYSGDGPPPEFDEYRDDYPDPYGYAEPTDLDVVAGHSIAADAGVDPFDRAYSRADDRDEDPDDDTEDLAAQQGPEHTDTEPVTLGAPGDALPDEPPAEAANRAPPRFNKSVAIGFVAATAVATIAVTATLLGMRSSPQPADETAMPTTQISYRRRPPQRSPAPTVKTAPIPFTATAWCPPGSTAAQSVAGHDPTQAWVCVRGGVDGQTLDIDLGRTMVVTALSITPGWVGADATGTDQWLQHRVDHPRAVEPVQRQRRRPPWWHRTPPMCAAKPSSPCPTAVCWPRKITMIVQQTSRAPADTAPTTTAPRPRPAARRRSRRPLAPAHPHTRPGLPPIPGLPGQQAQTDPADNTFAVSSIKVIGHPPR